MTVAAFDTLAAAEALQDAGLDAEKAKAIIATARAAAGAGREELATKTDIADLKVELAELRAEFKADIAALETRMTWRMMGVMAALLAAQGALIVALLQPAAS